MTDIDAIKKAAAAWSAARDEPMTDYCRGMEEMNHFKKGDKVTWTSTSGGYTRTKTGVIEIVVPAEQSPPRMRSKMPMPGMPRDHESYIVKVPGRGYYWPRVSLLKRTEQ